MGDELLIYGGDYRVLERYPELVDLFIDSLGLLTTEEDFEQYVTEFRWSETEEELIGLVGFGLERTVNALAGNGRIDEKKARKITKAHRESLDTDYTPELSSIERAE